MTERGTTVPTGTAGPLYAGVDLGGTKTAAGLVTRDGTVVRTHTVSTPAADGPEAVLDAVAHAVRQLGSSVRAVGVGSAGVIDPVSGHVVSATGAMPGWAGTDLRGGLVRRLGVPVVVENDVHAHARGEARCGGAAGMRHMLYVAVGTGIGASLLIDGRIHHGARSAAGHAGHLPVPAAAGRPCSCGGLGHAEAAGSGPAMLAAYRRRTGRAEEVTALAEVSARAESGDATATAVLAEGATALGQAIGGLANTLDPEAVLIGGGVSRCGAPWWEPLRTAVAAELLPPLAELPVVRGRLGPNAALLGAAGLASEASPRPSYAQQQPLETRK